MKIVHISTVHNPFDTRIFEKMSATAVAAGFDVWLVARHPRAETVDGVRIVPLRTRRNRLARATLGVSEAITVASSIDADIYHLHDPELLLGAGRLKSRGAVIYDMHENVAASVMHKEWLSRGLRPIVAAAWRILERRMLSALPVIYAELSYQKDYPWIRSTEFVLNMPAVERLISVPSAGRVTGRVGYIGTVTAARGSLVALKAIGLLKQSGLDVEFWCIGPASPDHMDQLEALRSRLGLNRVKFTGRLRAEEAWAMAASCQIGLATVLPLPNYVRSYPTKLFEYMALGLPVIASDFPLYREIVERHECGICVDPTRPEAVAGAIRKLMENPDAASAMGLRGRKAAQTNYRWEIEGRKLLKFYEHVRAAHGART